MCQLPYLIWFAPLESARDFADLFFFFFLSFFRSAFLFCLFVCFPFLICAISFHNMLFIGVTLLHFVPG